MCCSPWGCKESDRTCRLNNNSKVWGNARSGIICHSFHIHLSYLGPASCFCFVLFFDFSHPPFSQLFSHHYEGGMVSSGSQALLSLLGVLIHIWSPEIADGCYILAYWYGSGGDIPFHKDGKVWLFHFPKNLGPWHSSEWQTYSVLANSNFTKCTPCFSFQ